MKRPWIFAGILAVGVWAAGAARAQAPSAPETLTATDAMDARRWLHQGEMAVEMGAFDAAVRVYGRVARRFPGTRWARSAEDALARAQKAARGAVGGWDPALAGTLESAQAQRLLYIGDIAYRLDEPVIALRYYERAAHAAGGLRYARRAESKIRWVRFWKNPGP